ncbi:DUF6786 family protein [Flagellimonas amoyensis]|uniref:DUF6786 family protein n=1 Tax=Flagellimonas amoyensis TaxID=2169401 RepID=UPI001901DF21|nr:DUF6786 family protein [Allomuricauda amoyensis]
MNEQPTHQEGSFGHDLHFLQEHDPNLVLLQSDSSLVAVSPKFQAKVFTSSAMGLEGKSFGWINYEAFGKEDPHMNAYGGENRFWLGPEGSKFSLFFKSRDEMVFDNWKTPAPIDSESWNVVQQSEGNVQMEKQMTLKNYADALFEMKIERNISILDAQQISNMLGISTNGIQSVGFSTSNKMTNTGTTAWTEESGAPCIWMLDMFPPSSKTMIVIPFNGNVKGKVATTDYFGEIPEDRIQYADSILFFKADGKSRGKLGIPPKRARNVAGSYDALNHILTIALFDVDEEATYLNQEWRTDKDPFDGDAINAYNDGPLEDGSQMGPFYEIESVSPAAFLSPQASLTHNHNLFHFTGDEKILDGIAQKVLGVDIQRIKNKL